MANDKGLNCCAILIKITLIFINLFYLLVGLFLVGIGIFLLVNLSDINKMVGASTVTTGVLVGIMVVGAITILTAVLGIVGAASAFWPVLAVYSVFVFGLLALQIAGGICIYFMKEKIYNKETVAAVGKTLAGFIQNYTDDVTSSHYNENTNEIIDFIQIELKCCGLTSPLDWLALNPKYVLTNFGPPDSCNCIATTDQCTSVIFSGNYVSVWKKGCNESFVNLIQHYEHKAIIVMGSTTGVFIFFQIVTLALGLSLIGIAIRNKRSRAFTTRIENAAYTPLESYPTNTLTSDFHCDDSKVEYVPAPEKFAHY